MPSEGIELSPSANLLSDDEILRLAKLFVQHGITKIRLTGGEPTVRKNIAQLISKFSRRLEFSRSFIYRDIVRLAELRQYGLKAIAMTSNGIALHRKLPDLVEKGLTHLNLR